MAYLLKSLAIGYEVPSFNLDNKNNSRLAQNIHELYLSQVDVIKNDLELLELPNTNYLFMFTLVLKIDYGLMPRRDLETYFKNLESSISKEIEEYLISNNVMFKKIEQRS